MPRYLINEREAKALRDVVDLDKLSESLGFDKKHPRPSSNFPFRFKLLEAMGASTPNKANASIYFFGDSSTDVIDTDNVVNDSSKFDNASSGNMGVCISSSAYNILLIHSTNAENEATEYMGLASTSYGSTETPITIDNLEPMNGVGTTNTTLSVVNKFNWNITDNGQCYAKYNQYTSGYDLIQSECT